MEILKQFSGLTKQERTTWVQSIIDQINEGIVSPLSIHTQVKCLEDMLKELTGNETYKASCLDEAAKHGKAFELYNAKFSVREVGVKYDYSQCGDNVLNELVAKQQEIDEMVKARQKMLQTVPTKGMMITDESSGETFTVYPPAKSSSTSVTVTLK